jgi:hypothetical protein
MRYAHGRQTEHGPEVQCEPCPARMVASRRVDEQDVGRLGERTNGRLELRPLAQRK